MKYLKIKNIFCYGMGGLSYILSNILSIGARFQSNTQIYYNAYTQGLNQALIDVKDVNHSNATLAYGEYNHYIFSMSLPFQAVIGANLGLFAVICGGKMVGSPGGGGLKKAGGLVLALSGYAFFLLCQFSKSIDDFAVSDSGNYSGYRDGMHNITGNPHDPADQIFASIAYFDKGNYSFALLGIVFVAAAIKSSAWGEGEEAKNDRLYSLLGSQRNRVQLEESPKEVKGDDQGEEIELTLEFEPVTSTFGV